MRPKSIEMKLSFLTLCVGSLLVFSCANEKEPSKENSVPSVDTARLNNAPTQPQATPITLTPAENRTTQSNSPASGMNPAHGEPGHRCDIAVGAPLNSPPASATSTPVIQQSTPAFTPPPSAPGINTTPATPVNTTPSATAPGMNPPHGQPGHDCSIAVGAPLNK